MYSIKIKQPDIVCQRNVVFIKGYIVHCDLNHSIFFYITFMYISLDFVMAENNIPSLSTENNLHSLSYILQEFLTDLRKNSYQHHHV